MKRSAMRPAAQASAALRFPAHSIERRVGTSFKHVQRLPPGGTLFLSRLVTGESLGAAASAAFSESPSFELLADICGLLQAGAFTTVLCGES